MRGDAKRPRVVVVDDSRMDRELAADALRSEVRLELCAGGEQALAALAREPADLVVSDLTMPGISGLDLLERIRREAPGTDFVFLTGKASVESAVGALRMGAADYLLKPIQAEELVLVVQRLLAKRALVEENTRLRDMLQTVEACRALATCLDPAEVYAVALDLLLRSLNRERGLALFRRTNISLSDALILRGFSDGEENRIHELLVDEKQVDVEAFREIGSSSRGPVHSALRQAGIAVEGLLAVPVAGEESESGVLFVLEDGQPPDESDLERTRIIAGHAGLSLRNAEQYDRAREKAFIDDVTELYNVRYLLLAADHEIRRADRYGNPLSVLFLDLDRFKLVNDRYGHLVGSRALRQLGGVLASCVRQVDTLARYGGDEFTILLVDTGHDHAMQIAERIRSTVADTWFDGGRGESMQLSLSVGVATYPDHGRSREELLDLSDKAMYRAKSVGRNKVCSANELGDLKRD
jgi:two-component system cell cycle response regulator